jgi:V/A-type H+-transporting ATPase subunit I
MYGTPAYNEADPTTFLAVSYMLMFGSMFGDVGQGFVLFAGGLYLLKVRRIESFGGILARIGASSIAFGFLYGSIFGNEEILEPILFHPLENINTVLIYGVLMGVILTTISYIYNFINSASARELEDGIFGREGAAGFVFYAAALYLVFNVYRYGSLPVPVPEVIVILVIPVVLMVLKQPLASLIEGKRPLYHEPVGDYYIESIFGVIETVLGMLSKTISFVRIGAFALNHAGLFIAFVTVSNMMRTKPASIAVLVLGNLIIIGLEGLIVFIQGLRLEYYELFSRYFSGDGEAYNPVELLYEEEQRQ